MQTLKKELETLKAKLNELNRSNQSLMLEKQEQEAEFRNALTQLEMINKIAQQKLELAEKKKIQLSRQVLKKDEQLKFQVEARGKDKSFYEKMKQKLERQVAEVSQQLQNYRRQSNKTISQLTLQKNQLKRDLEMQQTASKEKMTELYLQMQKGTTADRDILELRRQIERLSNDNAENQKIHMFEKDEMRKYIAKINADTQTVIMTNNEEKRHLRQEIQVARQQQVMNYTEKVRKLKEEIKSLNQDHSKLVYIVQSNENNFNALVQQNKALLARIQELENENHSIIQGEDSNKKMLLLQQKIRGFQDVLEGKTGLIQYEEALKLIQSMKQQNYRLRNELNSIPKNQQVNVVQVIAENAKLKNENTQFQNELSVAQATVTHLRSQTIANIQKSSSERSQSFTETFNKYEKVLTENAQIRSQLSYNQREFNERQKQLEKVHNQIAQLEVRLQQKSKQILVLQRNKNEAQSHWRESQRVLQLTKHEMQREIETLKEQTRYSKRKNEEIQSDLRTMRDNYQKQLNTKEEQYRSLNRQHSTNVKEKVQLERQILQYSRTVQQLNIKNADFRSQLTHLRQQLSARKMQENESIKKSSLIHVSSVPVSYPNTFNEEIRTKIHFQDQIIVQKEREIEELKRSQGNIRSLVEEKNAKIETLMSENYSIRLTVNEKDKYIETNQALSRVEREKLVHESDNLLRANTRLQQQFNKRESEYRQEIDRLRQDLMKLEDQMRAQRQDRHRLGDQGRNIQMRNSHIRIQESRIFEDNSNHLQKILFQNTQLRSQLALIQMTIQHKNQQLLQLKDKLAEVKTRLNDKLKQNQQQSRVNLQLNSQIRQLNRENEMKINLYQFEKKNFESNIQEFQRQKYHLSNQLEQFRRRLSQMNAVERECDKMRGSLQVNEQRIIEIQIVNQRLQKQNANLQSKLNKVQPSSGSKPSSQRELNRLNQDLQSLKTEQNHLRSVLQRKQQELKSVRTEILQLKYTAKETTQKDRFQRIALEQELSLLKGKYDSLNSKYERQRSQLTIKQSECQRRLQECQNANDSQSLKLKQAIEEERRQTQRVRQELQSLKHKNSELLSINREIRNISQESMKKLKTSLNQNQQLQLSYKANEELINKTAERINSLKDENNKLKTSGIYSSPYRELESNYNYEQLLLKIRELQSKLLREEDTIYKLQHQNRTLANHKIMADLQIKRISSEIELKNQDIFELREYQSNSLLQKQFLTDKIRGFEHNSRQENTYLRTIVTMLDQEYETKESISEIQILLKISAQIEELIKTSNRLEYENKLFREQGYEEDLTMYGRELVDFLADFLLQRGLLTEDDNTKLKIKRQSVQFAGYESRQQFFEQIERQIKSLLECMMETQMRYLEVHRNVLKDVNFLLEDHFRTGNKDCLVTIKKSLEHGLQV